MKSKPDDRRDNVDKIQKHIDDTIQNIEMAEEMIAKTDNPKTKAELTNKNERRREALEGMRSEIQDEAAAQKKNNG